MGKSLKITAALTLLIGVAWGEGEDIQVEGEYLRMVAPQNRGGVIEELHLMATGHDVAGSEGLLQEGFGMGSFYAPNRRLNERIEVAQEISDRPVLRLLYDCEGPNIQGLRVTRTMEPMPDEASIRVTWRIENKGAADQWVSPWVRSSVTAGGTFDANDVIDVPTLEGIQQVKESRYFAASRNWVAVTDPVAKETVYGVFNADHIHSFLAIHEMETGVLGEEPMCGFQASFVPFLLKKGETWETVYRLNVVRGLSRVHFATDEFAVEAQYEPGTLRLLLAGARKIPTAQLQTRIRDERGEAWRVDGKQFDLDPNLVVRCSYAWVAPEPGAYEILSQMEQQPRVLRLGKDTGSPHGGIDTQFTTGDVVSTAMAPWTDAPFKLDRGPRVLKRAMAMPYQDKAVDTAVWIESPLEKLYPGDQPEPTGELQPTARISLAANEMESFQVAICPPAGHMHGGLTLKAGTLMHERGLGRINAEDIQVYRVGYVPISIPTHFESPTGPSPDPLHPLTTFTAPGGEITSLWVTVHARAGLAPGLYKGSLELVIPGGHSGAIHVEARVYDFELPARPSMKTDFGYTASAAVEACKRMGWRGSDKALGDAYLSNALDHRVTLRELTQLPTESANYGAALARYKSEVLREWGSRITTVAVPPSLIDLPELLGQANQFVQEQRLSELAFCPLAATPPRPAWPRLFERIQEWNQAAPSIPVMVTTVGLSPFIPETLPIWAIHLPVLDTTNGPAVLERIKQGGEAWWFLNHEPSRPYGNFFIDFTGMEHRILFWQAWALGIRGMYYQSINTAPGPDPYMDLADVTPANGNGLLVYPSADGPVNSIRWEVIRDGIEDYDYLTLYQRRLAAWKGAEADKARLAKAGDLQELVADLIHFPREHAPLDAKRDAIAKAIEEMGAR